MPKNIIKVKYESDFKPKIFEGKGYTYYSTINVVLDDYVIAPTPFGEKIAKVIETNIAESEIEAIKPYMKTIEHKIDKNKFLKENIVEAA